MSTPNRCCYLTMKWGNALQPNRLMAIRLAHAVKASIDDKPHTYRGLTENYGPPLTYDYIPIPFQPYKIVYAELQKKWNMWLAGSFAFFVFSCIVGHKHDIFGLKLSQEAASFRNRKKINARLDAEEAAAKSGGE